MWGRGVHGETGDGDAARQKAPKRAVPWPAAGLSSLQGGSPKCKTLPEQNLRVPLPRLVSRTVGLLPSWGSQPRAGCPGVMGTHGTAGARALAQSRERSATCPAPRSRNDPEGSRRAGPWGCRSPTVAGGHRRLPDTSMSSQPRSTVPSCKHCPAQKTADNICPTIHPPALSGKSQKD